MQNLEQLEFELLRKGEQSKARWIRRMKKELLKSYAERILENDKTVLQELVLPKWVSWELLRAIAEEKLGIKKEKICVLCGKASKSGIDFNGKFICEFCFLKLKNWR